MFRGPGLYYFSPGAASEKFFIFHEGGGFCGSDFECLDRSHNWLGSSRWDAETLDLEALGNLKFSRLAKENPLMYNWNHIYVRYCDGGYYSGYRDKPISVNGREVFFSGGYITEALFQDLQRFGFKIASDVVLSGCSAGAIRIFGHLDTLRDYTTAAAVSSRVVGLADSGFYMDLEIFTPLKRYVVKEMNGSHFLSARCKSDHFGVEEKCLVGSVASSYLQTPLFAFQSRFDLDQRSCEMEKWCSLSDRCIESYGRNLTRSMKRSLQHPHGYFLDSCERHCSYHSAAPTDARGIAPLHAFAMYYEGGEAFYGQTEKYPCPACCSPRVVTV